LLAVTITKDHEFAAPFTDVVNTFYGRGEIPIGVCHSGVAPEEGKFNGLANQMDFGKLRYPHDLISGKQAPDAVTVLRQALSGEADGSVVIAQVGFSTNLAKLLDSPPDAISPMAGAALVKRKVRLLSIMAGAFEKIPNDKGERYDHKEYNVVMDIPSAKRIAAQWPTPIVWSGFEIGIALAYPHQSILSDYRYTPHHPLAEAYHLYIPPPHDRPTWDLTAVLYALRPDRDYFDLSVPGKVHVADDGLTTFEENRDGAHRFLILRDKQQPRTLEALVQLSSQPPTTLPHDHHHEDAQQ
jgi:inosine-uridine nucleoside N-ribohydrolase